MGLRETLQKAAVVAVKATGNVASWVYYNIPSTDRKPDILTGKMTAPDKPIRIRCPFDQVSSNDLTLFGKSSSDDKSARILATDMKALVPALQLSGITPNSNHTIDFNGTRYSVIRYTTDPAGALLTVFVRA